MMLKHFLSAHTFSEHENKVIKYYYGSPIAWATRKLRLEEAIRRVRGEVGKPIIYL